MTPTAIVSVEEYLNTDYSPDCDYVNGVLEDRNVGLKTHGRAQAAIFILPAPTEIRVEHARFDGHACPSIGDARSRAGCLCDVG
jgi:hypothetical protein